MGEPCSVEAEVQCLGFAQGERVVCTGGYLQAAAACSGGQLCDSDSGQCLDVVTQCAGQDPGAAVCDGADRIVCGPDLVTSTASGCASIQHCQQATGNACAVCLAGAYDCDGDELRRCKSTSDGYDHVDDCSAGECNESLGMCTVLICDPNQYSCDPSSNELKLCNGIGTAFTMVEDCGTGTCDLDNEQCDVCTPDQPTGCEDVANKRVCDSDGQRDSIVLCSSEDPNRPLCTGTGECVECTDAQTHCSAQNDCFTPICVNWSCGESFRGQSADCTGGFCNSVGECKSCKDGESLCTDDWTLESCDDGEPITTPCANACVTASPTAASCGGSCRPGDDQCLGDNRTLQSCETGGSWGGDSTCTYACLSTPSPHCGGSCVPGTEQCDNNETQLCGDDGEYGSVLACSYPDTICDAGSGQALCVANPPYTIGNDSAFTAPSSMQTNWIAGNPIQVQNKSRVISFGLISPDPGETCNVRMLLYTDSGGQPLDRVGISETISLPAPSSGSWEDRQIPALGTVNLDADTTYWLMAQYNCNPALLVLTGAGQPDLKYYDPGSFSAPTSLSGASFSTVSEFSLNHYLEIQDRP